MRLRVSRGHAALIATLFAIIGFTPLSASSQTLKDAKELVCPEPPPEDGDSVPAEFDNCPLDPNEDQADSDFDATGDVCDLFPFDFDNDGVDISIDNCPFTPNEDQTDTDGDGQGDGCDFCDDTVDFDADSIGDDCDNCPENANVGQDDSDFDGIGDACDALPADSDNDGLDNDFDNCPFFPNAPEQDDFDSDGVGDACDNCPDVSNDQQDFDFDGIGNECDSFIFDFDNDGADDSSDNCFDIPNSDQADTDGDFAGNACDFKEGNCINGSDDDNDGFTDCDDCDCFNAQACQPQRDNDDDGIPNVSDNCPNDFNPDQTDTDGEGAGDACDSTPNGALVTNGSGNVGDGTTENGASAGCSLNPRSANAGFGFAGLSLIGFALLTLRFRKNSILNR